MRTATASAAPIFRTKRYPCVDWYSGVARSQVRFLRLDERCEGLLGRCGADLFDGCVRCRRGGKRPGYEEVVIVEVAVHASCNLGGLRAVGGATSAQEDDRHYASNVGLGVGGEPSEAGAGVRAGSGLAEDGFFVEIQAHAARRAVFDRAGHAV